MLGGNLLPVNISIHALREEGDHLGTGGAAACSHFYPRPPRGGRRKAFLSPLSLRNFYPRPPRGGRQASVDRPDSLRPISIHALREEGDKDGTSKGTAFQYFYPRPPRGGRRSCTTCPCHSLSISIHALREEGDSAAAKIIVEPGISIHALREEGDVGARDYLRTGSRFLSTPSARRATALRHTIPDAVVDFYPRPPRGGRPLPPGVLAPPFAFLSTPSARRATNQK